jgi:methionyl-tRNA formyltransferase
MRLLYEGELTVGWAVHRISPEFDAGPILGLRTRRLPEAITPEMVFAAWFELLIAALDEAVARALAGDPGDPQDESRATYSAPFSEEERWLSWDEPALTVQRRAVALTMTGPFARANFEGEPVTITGVRALPDPAPDVSPGTVLSGAGDTAVVRVADGAVEVTMGDG